MRRTLFVGLTLLASAAAVAADKPIPQDAARMEKRRRERLEWNRATLAGTYDKVGKKDPKWDEPARRAMDLAARMFSLQGDPAVSLEDIYKPAKAAVDAGCDDPLLLYLYNRSTVGPSYPGDAEAARRLQASAKALAASKHPVFRRAIALQLAGAALMWDKAPTEAARKEAERDYDASLALLPESVAKDVRNDFWEGRWLECLVSTIGGYRRLGLDGPAAYERVDAKLAKVPELKALRLLVRGYFWHGYAWEARTNAYAPRVPAGGFETFESRLAVAKKALNESWRLRPDDAETADLLLDIEKAVGGDRAAMELWFERAMKADGDSRSACLTKLDWLDPKWHGTAAEMLAFGRACRATKNWRAGITLLAAEAHLRYYFMAEPAERPKYMSSPEVWSEVKAVYDEYLAHYPADAVARSKYATLCYLAARYPEAHAQFQAVGDDLTAWTTFPRIPLETMKQMKESAAQIVSRQTGGAANP